MAAKLAAETLQAIGFAIDAIVGALEDAFNMAIDAIDDLFSEIGGAFQDFIDDLGEACATSGAARSRENLRVLPHSTASPVGTRRRRCGPSRTAVELR